MIFLIFSFLSHVFSFPAEVPINNYFITTDPFDRNLTLFNYPLSINCLSFEAHYHDEFDIYEDTYTNPIIENLRITILFLEESIFDIKITDSKNKRYEIPSRIPFPKDSTLAASCKNIEKIIMNKNIQNNTKHQDSEFLLYLNKTSEKYEFDNPSFLYKITVIKSPFAIQVLRKSTEEYVYNSFNSSLIFTDKYIETQNRIHTDFIMGFGERNYKTRLDVGDIYTTWSRDEPNEIEDGWPPGKNIYGYHPMYLTKEASGKFNIGFMRMSTAFDVLLLNDSFKIISIGGIVHWKYFLGNEYPNEVVEKYHQYLGGFGIPPFWAMGLHQSRWGYKNIQAIQKIAEEYENLAIPVDAFHIDIDYMYSRQMFQVDQIKFNKAQFLNIKQKIVPIVDIGVYPNFSDPVFLDGVNRGVFIKNNFDEFFVGRCWPGTVVFPDFFHPEIKFYWEKNLKNLYSYFNYSGIWLDMNEISNFCDGECLEENQNFLLDKYKKFKEDEFEKSFPYTPGFRSLSKRTISINAKHYNNELEQNLHPLNSLLHSYQTYNFLKFSLSHKLPFILSRATFPGSGKYVSHWTGDIKSDWTFMELSIPSMFSFNLFGIPMIGADICGFEGDTTELLCSRWAQLGSLYPFARNHNHEHAKDQEFYKLGPTLLETARKALNLRYSLLKYYYSIFIQSKGKGMIIRPLFFEWPHITYFYHDNLIDSEFLIGKDILCIPLMTEYSNHTFGFLPDEQFYMFKNGEKTIGSFIFMFVALNESLPLFVRAGSIIHFQMTEDIGSTQDLDNRINLFVALKNNQAKGYVIGYEEFNDDNIDSCIENDYSCLWEFKFEIKIVQNFGFELGLEVNSFNNTLKNEGFIIVNEIHVIGLEEKDRDVLYSYGHGEMFILNHGGANYFKKANLRLEGKKIVIECGFSKNLKEDEKILIIFNQNEDLKFFWVYLFIFLHVLMNIYILK